MSQSVVCLCIWLNSSFQCKLDRWFLDAGESGSGHGWPQWATKRAPELSLPSPVDWGENRRAKRLEGWHSDSWVRKGKSPVHKGNRGVHSLPPISRQVSGRFLEGRASAHVAVVWEDRPHNHLCPLFLLFSWGFSYWVQWHSAGCGTAVRAAVRER